jgi:nucleotidyltransferase-like protein
MLRWTVSVSSIASASRGAAVAPLDRRGHAIDLRPIAPILARVVLRWNPLQIWLFGSHARGDAGIDSDWDLLAVVPDCPEPADFDDPMTVWRIKRQPDVPCDLVVYRASDFEADRPVPNTLAYATALDGVLVSSRQPPDVRES